MSTVFKIFPPIGIARLGNSPGDGPGDFYYGPEYPGQVVVPPSYKDAQGRVLRQAARFRIYRYDDNVLVGEVTADPSQQINITWTVELANTKAAYYQFEGIGKTGPPRNPHVANRSLLMITPGPRTISPSSSALFDNGSFLGVQVPLGEIQTDSSGRLTVLGGFGNSGSPVNAPLPTFANNDGWYDDISDGPVNAVVTIAGTSYPAVGAWVICPPTRFAPPVPQVISLYDTLFQTAVNLGLKTVPSTPSFTYDIYPILVAQFLLQWVAQHIPAEFYAALTAAMNQDANVIQRNAVFRQMRPPSVDPTTPTPREMPPFWTTYFADVQNAGWVNQPVTAVQYYMLQQWAAGNFLHDWPGIPSTAITPDGLTRAALENCSGGPFFPGIETSFLTAFSYPYIEAFRLDSSQLHAGDLTHQNAVPWQADFEDCDYEAPLSWWPVSRPEQVFPPGSPTPVEWDTGVTNKMDMVKLWSTLGFLRQAGNSIYLYPS
jgi:hypothetical protein